MKVTEFANVLLSFHLMTKHATWLLVASGIITSICLVLLTVNLTASKWKGGTVGAVSVVIK